jgi:hypothetical protein
MYRYCTCCTVRKPDSCDCELVIINGTQIYDLPGQCHGEAGHDHRMKIQHLKYIFFINYWYRYYLVVFCRCTYKFTSGTAITLQNSNQITVM